MFCAPLTSTHFFTPRFTTRCCSREAGCQIFEPPTWLLGCLVVNAIFLAGQVGRRGAGWRGAKGGKRGGGQIQTTRPPGENIDRDIGMPRSPATSLSERDVRKLLDVVQRVAASEDVVCDRYLTLLRTLGELTGADLAVTARIARSGKRPIQFQALLDVRDPATSISPSGVMTGGAPGNSSGSCAGNLSANAKPPRQKRRKSSHLFASCLKPTDPPPDVRGPTSASPNRRADLSVAPVSPVVDLSSSGPLNGGVDVASATPSVPHPVGADVPTVVGDVAVSPASSHCITSIYHLGQAGHYAAVVLHRSPPDSKAPFGDRERQIVDFAWQALGQLHEQPLRGSPAVAAPVTAPGADSTQGGAMHGAAGGEGTGGTVGTVGTGGAGGAARAGGAPPLDKHLTRVLAALRRKGSLSAAAQKLGLSRSEFARRTRAIYRHFQVRSRHELQAKLAQL